MMTEQEIITEAKERFRKCQDWESQFRQREREDIKFANGDPDNQWQWEQTLYGARSADSKPCLTINKVRQHNLQIINDAKQNKPGVNVRPVADEATYEAAQVFEGVIRHIEYQSNAEQAYDTATTFQVEGGIGYWYVDTDYVSDDSFDQEIFIRRVKNPDLIYLDPDINEADGSDAKFGFIFDDVPRKEFDRLHPQFKDDAGSSVLGSMSDDWLSKDYVRVATYYRRTMVRDKLIAFVDPNAMVQVVVRRREMLPEIRPILEQARELAKAGGPEVEERELLTENIEWFRIAGNKIIDKGPWKGRYIPIVRVVGEETIVNGQLDRKGHTRLMKDPQRMLNYWVSEATYQVALQSKSPYLAPVKSIEGLETYWANLNRQNPAVLPYNSTDEDGKEIPPPQRIQPPVMATAYIEGMRMSEMQMMMSSGQYQSQFGANENATSGKAINERQRQGDNATYHFIDNLAMAIRFTGKILIDLIPKIYDTARVVRIMGKDGTENTVQIDPNAPTAFEEEKKEGSETASIIFNPAVGRYDVQSDVGPGYATRRQEAFNAMTQIAAQNKEFMQIAGDVMWRNADFPGADQLAQRWARVIPPAIKGDGPSPEVQQLEARLQQAQDAIAVLNAKLSSDDTDHNIRGYEATTKRLAALGNAGPIITEDQLIPLIRQTLISMFSAPNPEIGMPAPQVQQPMQPQQQPMGGIA